MPQGDDHLPGAGRGHHRLHRGAPPRGRPGTLRCASRAVRRLPDLSGPDAPHDRRGRTPERGVAGPAGAGGAGAGLSRVEGRLMERAKRRGAGLSLLVVATIVPAAVGCATITGSGKVVSTPVPVSSFSRLQVSSAFEVNVSFGEQEAVTLHVDDNVTGHLDVGVSNGTLHIGLKH